MEEGPVAWLPSWRGMVSEAVLILSMNRGAADAGWLCRTYCLATGEIDSALHCGLPPPPCMRAQHSGWFLFCFCNVVCAEVGHTVYVTVSRCAGSRPSGRMCVKG